MKNIENGYLIGVLWFLSHSTISVFNDTIMKYTGLNLPSFEVAFFRFLFSTISLLPFIFYYGKSSINTTHYFVHFLRGLLLFIGISAWVYGLKIAPVTTATLISFSVPLFTLILAMIFLNENIIWQRWVVTFVGFIGIAIVLQPTSSEFNIETIVFVFAAIMFALLDIVNKKFVYKETMVSMLFYSALVTTCLAFPISLFNWVKPSLIEIGLLAILGCSANLILFFLLKAFSLVDATALAPYRYFELLLSSIASYIIFNEQPGKNIIWGAMIIIPSTLFIIYSEKKNSDDIQQNQEL